MGLINNDVYRCANGVQKEGTYISFGTETLYLCQSSSNPTISAADRVYNVRANYRVYWDKSCRDGNMSFLDLQSVSTQLTAAQLETTFRVDSKDFLKGVGDFWVIETCTVTTAY
jgi:hypothetical protein